MKSVENRLFSILHTGASLGILYFLLFEASGLTNGDKWVGSLLLFMFIITSLLELITGDTDNALLGPVMAAFPIIIFCVGSFVDLSGPTNEPYFWIIMLTLLFYFLLGLWTMVAKKKSNDN
ncbi:hypothetical protein [Salibacterium aidingense]|uniref:hypothetical protein n=1 Tax=Salibacterium aidingense TaxID=384933 RepID=UPI00047B8598|nr:hypothetical protein [Salibacterium aidingense]